MRRGGWEEEEMVPPSWKVRRRKRRCGHQRRGKGSKRKSKFFKSDNILTITLNNCRGWKSKQESIKEMLDKTKADIAMLNETLLRHGNKVFIKGYHTVSRNRKIGGGGGISTSVVNDLKQKSVTIKESDEDDEFIVTRLEHCSPALTMINWYGQQEQRKDPDQILATWNRIKGELEAIRTRGDFALLAGDMNRKIGNGEWGVDGNYESTSLGGDLVRELLATEDYILINNTDLAEGGPWTWEDPKDRKKPWEEKNKSCLDLVIVCKQLFPFVKSLRIDSRRDISLKRPGWKKGKKILTYADHYTLVLKVQDLPRVKKDDSTNVRWNLEKEGGWEEYKRLSQNISGKIEEVVDDKNISVQEVKHKFDKIHKKILFQSFGKVTLKAKKVKPEKKGNEGQKRSAKEKDKGPEYDVWQEERILPEGWLDNEVNHEGWKEVQYLPEEWRDKVVDHDGWEETQDLPEERMDKDDDYGDWEEGLDLPEGQIHKDSDYMGWEGDQDLPEGRIGEYIDHEGWIETQDLPKGWVPTNAEEETQEADRLLENQNKKIEDGVLQIKGGNWGRVGAIWKISQDLKGTKRGVEAVAIKDPKSGKLVVSVEEIKKVSLEYCLEVLKKNPIKDGFEEDIHIKDVLHKLRMEEETEDEEPIKKETFDAIVEKFKKSNKRNYDFLVKSSEGFKSAVFKFGLRMIEEESYPEDFDNTTLHQVYKKGCKNVLSSFRYIHSQTWCPRVTEALVVSGPKKKILKSASPMQCGGLPGHRASEHLFSMLSVIALYLDRGDPFLAQLWDLVQFFDKEVLKLVMDSLYSSAKIKGKEYRNIFEMSRRNRIRVRTGAGYSEYADAGELLAQGSGGAALYSQKYLDSRMVKMFDGSEDEFRYGSVLGSPAIWMDDVFRGVGSVNAAIAGNVKLDMLASLSQLSFHEEKSCYILMGSKTQREEMRKEIEIKPLRCGSFETKEKETDKWLGFWLHCDGLSASVAKTVEEREKKVKGALFEAVALVEDYRAVRISGFQTAIDLWELAILPSLLHGCEVWTDISKETEKKLEDLQVFYLSLVLQVGPGTPRVGLLAQTGLMSIKYRIWVEKTMMILHLRGLEESSMASRIWKEQRTWGWPGLCREVTEICEALEVMDTNDMEFEEKEKKHIRKTITRACREKDEKELKANMGKKCEGMKDEDCEIKPYLKDLTLYEARELFKIKTNMNKIRGNYKNMSEHKAARWLCVGCQLEVEVNSHILSCKFYEDDQAGLELDTDRGLVEFFRRVMKKRMDILDEKK